MSNPSEKGERVLEKLGLTSIQSKVYIATFNSGPATAKLISKVARVAREDVYRVMPALQKLGLITRHITKPTVFEAIPPKEAVTFLLERRNQETDLIFKEVNKFLTAHKRANRNDMLIEKSEKTVLFTSPEAVSRLAMYEFERAKQSMDGTINWETHKHGIVELTEAFNSAIRRGVKLRSVMDKPNEQILKLPRSAQRLFNNPSYKFRYIPNPPKCRVAIFDDKIGILFTSSDPNASKSAMPLWTNNPILVCLMKEYFRKLWDSAEEIPYQELIK